MPNNIVKSFADKTGKSISEIENLWDKAKEIVNDEYPNVKEDDTQFYKLVTGVLKKMLKIEEEVSTGDVATTAQPMKMHPEGCPIFKCNDDTFWHLHRNIRKHKQWYDKFYQDTDISQYAKNNKNKPFYIEHEDLGFTRKITF